MTDTMTGKPSVVGTKGALPLSLRLALRELRGGLSGFYVFIACIALGVAAIAGVNSVSRALTEGIAAEGRVILGGDLSFSLIHREATPEELAFLKNSGEVGTVATMRAMARLPDGSDQALTELKAVDGLYPHAGAVTLENETDLSDSLSERNDIFGVVVAPEFLDRLNLSLGDQLQVGAINVEVRDVISSEPDRLSGGIGFGPRMLMSLDGLRATGLVRPGSLIEWHYRIALPPGDPAAGSTAIVEAAGEQFSQSGWRIRTRDQASPRLAENIERFAQFLTLVGLTALVVGGVGVANAVSSFVDLKRSSIATLKCLGASGGLIFRLYFQQILLLAGVGIFIGLVVGAIIPFIAKTLLADLLPVTAAPNIYPAELGLALLYGLLVTVSFSLWPLGRARQMPASSLFADRAILSPIRPPYVYRILQLVSLVMLAAIAILLSADKALAFFYILAVIGVFIVLRGVGLVITWLARRAGRIKRTTWRMAIGNIHRPGALTPSVVLSLGLGLTLLVSLALIDTNLRQQLTGSMADLAPDFFFVDIQDAESGEFDEEIAVVAPGGDLTRVPMLRGRIVEVNGVPSSELVLEEDAWVLRGDRGITYANSVPENSTLVTGKWWDTGYDGPSLVSFDDEIAGSLGLAIGDKVTINVLGRNIESQIANTRDLEWESLSMNFVMVFSPNTFRGAPHAHLATLKLADGTDSADERAVLSAIAGKFPGITSVRVRDAIAAVNKLVGDLALAVRSAASLALVISVIVLGGALAAGHRQRQQDAVILKTLGATRSRLLWIFTLEYGLLGLATALFAVAVGSLAAWYVVSQVMTFQFTFSPGIAIAAALISLGVTLGLGLLGTWRILSVKPAPMLRNL